MVVSYTSNYYFKNKRKEYQKSNFHSHNLQNIFNRRENNFRLSRVRKMRMYDRMWYSIVENRMNGVTLTYADSDCGAGDALMSLRWSNDNGLDVVRFISADGQRLLRFEKWRDDDACDACCDDDGVDCSRCLCCCIERCSDKSMLLICHSVRAVIRFLVAGAVSVIFYL